jgi:acyl carrier protein
MSQPNAVGDRVNRILAEVLSIDLVPIVPHARIMDDLGAESIDLLDLRFRLEREFGLKITNRDLVTAFGERLSEEEFHAVFTVAAMTAYVEARVKARHG